MKLTYRILFFLFIAILIARLVYLVKIFAVNVYFIDQWDLLFALIRPFDIWRLFFWTNGPHYQGLSFIVSWILSRITNFNATAESWFIVVLLSVSTALGLVLKKRLFKRLTYVDFVIPLFFLSSKYFDILIVVPNSAHGPFPIFLLMCLALVFTLVPSMLQALLIALINFFLIFSGFGMFIVPSLLFFLVVAIAKIKHNKMKLFYGVSLMMILLSIFLFFHTYTNFYTSADCFQIPHPQFHDYAIFATLVSSSFIGFNAPSVYAIIFGLLATVGLIVLSGYHAWLFIKNISINEGRARISAVVFSFVSFSLLFSLFVAIGRTCNGMDAALLSRYRLYMLPAFFGVYLSMHTINQKIIRNVVFLLFWILLLTSEIRNNSYQEDLLRYHKISRLSLKNCVQQGFDLKECEKKVDYKVFYKPSALQDKLEYFKLNKFNLYSE